MKIIVCGSSPPSRTSAQFRHNQRPSEDRHTKKTNHGSTARLLRPRAKENDQNHLESSRFEDLIGSKQCCRRRDNQENCGKMPQTNYYRQHLPITNWLDVTNLRAGRSSMVTSVWKLFWRQTCQNLPREKHTKKLLFKLHMFKMPNWI